MKTECSISMKAIFLILCTGYLLTSCATVYFDREQPENGQRLSEIPKQYQGVWKDAVGGIEIRSKSILYTFVIGDNETSGTGATETTEHFLSDSVTVMQTKKYLVLNEKNKEGYWQLFIAEMHPEGDIYLYEPTPSSVFVDNFKLKDVTASVEGASDTEHQYISGALTQKQLSTLLIKDNLIFILKKDGTISGAD